MSKRESITIKTPRFKVAGDGFSTSREVAAGAPRKYAEPLEVVISDGTHIGYGECLPYKHYKESGESVTQQIKAIEEDLLNGLTREELLQKLPAGAARNAVDAALWDLECKQEQRSIWQKTQTTPPEGIQTVYTLSVATPGKMVQQLKNFGPVRTIKMKLSGQIEEDIKRIQAVNAAAPESNIIVDANEGMKNAEEYLAFIEAAKQANVTMIEQPFPAGKDDLLRNLPHPIPLCADESFRSAERLEELKGKYEMVNIKLDKTGGLTKALQTMEKAKAMGFEVMVGTMLASSLSMAPAYVLAAKGAAYVDLDSPMLLAEDRKYGLKYHGDTLSPPSSMLWGGARREKSHRRDNPDQDIIQRGS